MQKEVRPKLTQIKNRLKLCRRFERLSQILTKTLCTLNLVVSQSETTRLKSQRKSPIRTSVKSFSSQSGLTCFIGDSMSMLTRFRKQGGFNQLLALIELCDPAKQRSLLHLVGTEDPGWAYLLRSKVLTRDRIMNWPQKILMEITVHLSEPVLLALYSSLNLTQKQRLLASLDSDVLVRLSTEINENSRSEFTDAEKNAASIKLIQIVREMEGEGQLKFSAFDPGLCLDHQLAA